jgi:hypothetical protein
VFGAALKEVSIDRCDHMTEEQHSLLGPEGGGSLVATQPHERMRIAELPAARQATKKAARGRPFGDDVVVAGQAADSLPIFSASHASKRFTGIRRVIFSPAPALAA